MASQRWYPLAVLFATMILLTAANILYTNRVDHRREVATERSIAEVSRINHEWCSLLITLDDTYQATPPTNPTGINIAASIRNLRTELGC